MGTLYLDRRDIEVGLEGRALVLRHGGIRQGTVPLSLLERVVVHGHARIDAALLAHLADAGVGLVVVTGRGAGKRAVMPGRGHGDASRRLGQYRASQDPDWRRAWSNALVRRKLRAQRHLLVQALEQRPDIRHALTRAIGTLDGLLATLRLPGGVAIARARGLEGAGAAAYFAAYAALLPPSFGFHGRNRRPPRDPANALLSLGYTLLHGDAVIACHGGGLDPMLGFYHDVAWGRDSLAADLVESLRPRIDHWVWQQLRGGTFTPGDFSHDGAACLLGKQARSRFYSGIEDCLAAPRRALRRAVTRLGLDLGRGRDPADRPAPGDGA